MEVIFITGEARCGKSYLAKKLCNTAHMSYYFSSNGEHPFDDYMGQEAVILDDLRPTDFKFNELLKVLDNHMSSKVSARYHNIDLNCKAIYITSTVDIESFYKGLQYSNHEAVEQFRGRINTYYHVYKRTLDMSILNDDKRTYTVLVHDMPNPILTDTDIKLMTVDDRKEMALNALRGIADVTKYMVDKVQDMTLDDFAKLSNDDDNPFKK